MHKKIYKSIKSGNPRNLELYSALMLITK